MKGSIGGEPKKENTGAPESTFGSWSQSWRKGVRTLAFVQERAGRSVAELLRRHGTDSQDMRPAARVYDILGSRVLRHNLPGHTPGLAVLRPADFLMRSCPRDTEARRDRCPEGSRGERAWQRQS
jgi:hypothetical protein